MLVPHEMLIQICLCNAWMLLQGMHYGMPQNIHIPRYVHFVLAGLLERWVVCFVIVNHSTAADKLLQVCQDLTLDV